MASDLYALIAEHFLGWRRITKRLPDWPEPVVIRNELTGHTTEPYAGPWWWPDVEGEIPPFGCDLPDFSEDGWCVRAMCGWTLSRLGHGNGKNRASVEVAGPADVRVSLMVEIEVPYVEARDESLSAAFREAARLVLIDEGYIPRGGGHG